MRTSRQQKNGTGGRECSGAETSEEMFARFNKEEKEKVYCENCRYVKKIKIKDGLFYYCTLPRFLIDANNLKYDCNFYKRKWWKFWVEDSKRKILKGAQPKTDAGPKPDPRLISYVGPGSPKRRYKWDF